MNQAASRECLLNDMRSLGVAAGDILFIHSSFKSLGPVTGGAVSVIHALEEVVGPDGLILMPSFNLVERDRRAETWDLERTPSTVGWLTEYFRRMPGTQRSDHYSHSVAARGKRAVAFVSEHRSDEGWHSPWDLAPWGKTYGTHSPMVRAYRRGGKLLMLGVDYETSTYVHLVEVIFWNQLLKKNTDASFVRLNRPEMGRIWDRMGRLTRGKIGGANCRLFLIREYVDSLFKEVWHGRRAALYCTREKTLVTADRLARLIEKALGWFALAGREFLEGNSSG